jgi:hypothetical protein
MAFDTANSPFKIGENIGISTAIAYEKPTAENISIATCNVLFGIDYALSGVLFVRSINFEGKLTSW